jgi:hypothetical protein
VRDVVCVATNSTGNHRRALHPYLVLLILLLAIDLYKDGEYTVNLLIVSMSVSFYLCSYLL